MTHPGAWSLAANTNPAEPDNPKLPQNHYIRNQSYCIHYCRVLYFYHFQMHSIQNCFYYDLEEKSKEEIVRTQKVEQKEQQEELQEEK